MLLSLGPAKILLTSGAYRSSWRCHKVARSPKTLGLNSGRHLSQSELEQLRERLQERAKRKVGSLWRLFQWLSQHAEPPQAVPAVFQRELVQLCSKLQQRGRSDWPQKIWDIAKKWPDYHKYELFWSLFDANELYKGSEEEWTSHVLCLSQLERVENNARVEEKLGPNGRFVVRSLHLEYKWKVPQERLQIAHLHTFTKHFGGREDSSCPRKASADGRRPL